MSLARTNNFSGLFLVPRFQNNTQTTLTALTAYYEGKKSYRQGALPLQSTILFQSDLSPPSNLKTFNVVAWVLLVASSLYSILEPDIWSFTKEAEILPARWGFYVWYVCLQFSSSSCSSYVLTRLFVPVVALVDRYPLNVLLVAPILCQFVPDGNLLIIDGLSWDLPLLNTSTAIFIHLWIREWYLTGQCTSHIISHHRSPSRSSFIFSGTSS